MTDRGDAVYAVVQGTRPVVLASGRVVESSVREHGWTVASRAVVEVLSSAGSMTVPQIAARLSLARQNVQRQVDELIVLGHVRTVPNPAHRRSALVQLTPAGQTTFEQVHARELRELSVLAPHLTHEELATAARVLDALAADIADRASQEVS